MHNITYASTYLILIEITSSRLDRIKAHIRSNGITEIIRGNTGCASITSQSYFYIKLCRNFI